MRVPSLAAMAAAFLLLAAGLPEPSLGQAPPAPAVTVANPIAKRITVWDEYSGRFEAAESVEVRARVSGFIDKVHFKDGDLVKAGDLLFTIDQRPFEIALASAEAEVARAKAQVDLAENEVERARPLLKSGAVTERDFDQRSAALNVARAQAQIVESSLRAAQLNFEWTEVKAPISGRISNRKIDAGNLVTGGSSGTTLLTTIVALAPIYFVFDAAEADYIRYSRMNANGERRSSREIANPVRVRLADENEWAREGKMDFVDNQLNPRSGTMRGRAVFDNADGLLAPGVFGRLRLFGGEMDALLIPDSAVVSDQMRKIVFAVGAEGVVEARSVVLGAMEDGLRVVREGLTVDDKIVIEGLANPMVRPGAKVTPEPGTIKPIVNAAGN